MLRPQSMPTGERNVLRSNDSASLWNCTLSPGWTQDEVNILRLALMKFGIGNWSKIVDSQCLVGKTVAQMNLQTQRMLGQQSTAEFASLHIDPLIIGKINSQKQGPHIKRKNNFIVNTGGKLSKEEKTKRIQENKKLYGLSREIINGIVLPTAKPASDSIIDMETELELLKSELLSVREKIKRLSEKKSSKKQTHTSLSHCSSDADSQLDSSPCSPPQARPKIILRLKPRVPSPEIDVDFEVAKPKSFAKKRVYISESDDSDEPQMAKTGKRRHVD